MQSSPVFSLSLQDEDAIHELITPIAVLFWQKALVSFQDVQLRSQSASCRGASGIREMHGP